MSGSPRPSSVRVTPVLPGSPRACRGWGLGLVWAGSPRSCRGRRGPCVKKSPRPRRVADQRGLVGGSLFSPFHRAGLLGPMEVCRPSRAIGLYDPSVPLASRPFLRRRSAQLSPGSGRRFSRGGLLNGTAPDLSTPPPRSQTATTTFFGQGRQPDLTPPPPKPPLHPAIPPPTGPLWTGRHHHGDQGPRLPPCGRVTFHYILPGGSAMRSAEEQ